MFYPHPLNVSAKLSNELNKLFTNYRTAVLFRLQHAVPLPCTTVVTEKLAKLHGELHQFSDFRYPPVVDREIVVSGLLTSWSGMHVRTFRRNLISPYSVL